MSTVLKAVIFTLVVLTGSTNLSSSDAKFGFQTVSEKIDIPILPAIALNNSFSDIQKRNLSLPDNFSIELTDSGWKIAYGFSECGKNDGDIFLIDRINGEVKQLSNVLRVLKTDDVSDNKSKMFLKVFTKTYEDAFSVYQNLEGYRICVSLKKKYVYIGYILVNPRARGGGPSYKVDSVSYNILERRYDQ